MFKSKWKFYFVALLVGSIALLLSWLAIQAMIFWTNKTISEQDITIFQKTTELESYKSLTGFVKLQAIKELEGKYTEMPWSNHIKQVIAMLDEIRNLDNNQSGTLMLSDFNVSLDKITLKGRVSNLLLLYYSSPEKGIVSVIDRFKKLDFIKDMRIKNYNKDGDFFSFVLEANVIQDGK